MALNGAIQDELLVDSEFFSSLTRSFKKFSLEEEISSIITETDKASHLELSRKIVKQKMPDDPDVDEFLQLLDSLSFMKAAADVKVSKEDDVSCQGGSKMQDESTNDRSGTVLDQAIDSSSWTKEGLKQLLKLYEVCIAPIIDYLPCTKDGVVPNITIIPHEFLFSVPFCCLHDGKNEYFVERFTISCAPSLRALLLLNQRLNLLKCRKGNQKLKLLAMGDPHMALPGMRDLPYSGQEAHSVRAVFGEDLCQIALRNEATKELLLRQLEHIDILHIATHACPQDFEAKDEKPEGDYSMRGCLLLASSNEECEGVVSATEIASADCSCQMVTLSCCETGLGKVTGDGVIGLYRAFFAAGAASVLVTLWKIQDNVTPMFMEYFYEEFKATGNIPGSLRSAMLYCIHEKKLPPHQWAAFSYIGAVS